MATIGDRVWQHLIDNGVVRDSRVAGALPPAFRMPADGVPAPGEGISPELGQTAVVGIFRDLGVPAPFFQKEWRGDIVDFVYRVQKWPDAEALYAQVRLLLLDRMDYDMSGMRVIQSREWRSLQRIDSSKAQGFTAQHSILFETYSHVHG